MEITIPVGTHIAELCKLKLTEEEIKKFTVELSSIVNYVNTIQKLNVSSENIPQLNNNTLKLREDVVKEGLSTAEALANAPVSYNNYFVVPKLI